MGRLCLFCKYFCFTMGEQGYSEHTPSSPAEIECQKGIWYMTKGDGREKYKRCMEKAVGCAHYEEEK